VTTPEFLRQLRGQDVRVWLDGDRVRCSAPPGVLTAEHRTELARRRPEILAELRSVRIAVSGGSVVPIEARGSRVPFYGVPGHNGDVFCFVRLAHWLGADQPFFGLQPPGLHAGSSPLTSIEDLAEHFVRAILAHQSQGPFQIGGYCLGGLTAFEVARRLTARGHQVSAVALFGTSAPAALRPLNRASTALAGWVADRRHGLRRFARLSGRERVEWLRSKALRLTSPPDAQDEVSKRRLGVERATVAAAHHYRPEAYDGRIALFVPSRATVHTSDRPLDWNNYAAATDVFFGPDGCDGDTMLKTPDVETFAQHLREYLKATDRRGVASVASAGR
jgi:thioesterase domain-containing protein